MAPVIVLKFSFGYLTYDNFLMESYDSSYDLRDLFKEEINMGLLNFKIVTSLFYVVFWA
jgi:hypothetical protein